MHTILLVLALGALQPIELEVDMREAPQRLVHANMTIPAKPGPVVLVYPKWIQGVHAPVVPLADVVGLRITAGSRSHSTTHPRWASRRTSWCSTAATRRA